MYGVSNEGLSLVQNLARLILLHIPRNPDGEPVLELCKPINDEIQNYMDKWQIISR